MIARLFPVLLVVLVAGVASFARQHHEQARQAPSAAISGTRGAWAVDLLRRLGNDAPTAATVAYLLAWHRAEGGTASFNWLNTTQPAIGATNYNAVGVKNYPDYETGIQATAETLANGFYSNTLAGLVRNAPVVDDAEMGTWGTGGANLRAALAQTPATTSPDARRAALVEYAVSLQGIPYVRGARSASGGDCSGTMQHIFLTVAGIDIGATTFSQYPKLQPITEAELLPGDLWFGQYADDQHVGLVADVDGDGRWDLINNGGLADSLHIDYDFLSVGYFNQHTMGFRRAL